MAEPLSKTQKKQAVINAKAVPCSDCGHRYPSYVMDFDHRDGEVKVAQVAYFVYSGSLASLLTEIAKCDVVCSNCHRERTFGRGWKSVRR